MVSGHTKRTGTWFGWRRPSPRASRPTRGARLVCASARNVLCDRGKRAAANRRLRPRVSAVAKRSADWARAVRGSRRGARATMAPTRFGRQHTTRERQAAPRRHLGEWQLHGRPAARARTKKRTLAKWAARPRRRATRPTPRVSTSLSSRARRHQTRFASAFSKSLKHTKLSIP